MKYVQLHSGSQESLKQYYKHTITVVQAREAVLLIFYVSIHPKRTNTIAKTMKSNYFFQIFEN